MEKIFEKAQSYKLNCLQYVGLEDIGELELENIIDSDKHIVFIKEDNKQYQLFWGAEGEEDFIIGVKKAVERIKSFNNPNKRIFIEFIPPQLVEAMQNIGFEIMSEWIDFFLRDLQDMIIPEPKYSSIRYIKNDEYKEAAEATKKCIGYSREFYGEDEQTLKEWDSDENSCIFVAHDKNKVIGVCMMNIYGQDSEKGPVAWLRELAVDPNYQGRGIGYSLIVEGLRWGKEKGATRSFLAVDDENHNAIRLYEALGYKRNVERGQINMAR